ncbi:MAG: hypothetical protein HYZ28_20060 [Myxococcales bacterium]|nr:hypothetical protein [Myxococcales bacterium]
MSEKKAKPTKCIACKRVEGPAVPGATFTSNGANGMVISFWMCNQCAIPLGPSQGKIDMEDPTSRV